MRKLPLGHLEKHIPSVEVRIEPVDHRRHVS